MMAMVLVTLHVVGDRRDVDDHGDYVFGGRIQGLAS